jgi:hypothetical protein
MLDTGKSYFYRQNHRFFSATASLHSRFKSRNSTIANDFVVMENNIHAKLQANKKSACRSRLRRRGDGARGAGEGDANPAAETPTKPSRSQKCALCFFFDFEAKADSRRSMTDRAGHGPM